ncbi:MAG: undecaprenyl-diphosphate phosphatase, partial [Salinivirgaceae bacterium]|nr:undecaprenyl-diphosphate phosphatase [Salinivirgaceae bacterium]
MSPLESFILGIIQGITEFLPISSSGHLKIGEAILNTSVKDNLLFPIVVHGAT